ncbi:MAG: DeoR family transcriptional regulator [Patescibacteria group bacterium]
MSSQYLAYINDRIQRTTKALYRVTDLLSDKEPLKWEMRKKATGVFSLFISLQDEDSLLKPACFEKAEKLINQLISLFSLFTEERTVAGINFGVLQEEFNSIKRSIVNKKREWVTPTIQLPFPKKQIQDQCPNGQAKGQYIGQDLSDIKQKNTIENAAKSTTKKPQYSSNNQSREDRIINIIKDRKEVSTGELSAMFSECSEKTIQRDLLAMVAKGILKKEGDKRWRKYMLVS